MEYTMNDLKSEQGWEWVRVCSAKIEGLNMEMKTCGYTEFVMANSEICYPKSKSEFEIQAELYSELKALGYNVRGEVKGVTIDNGYSKGVRLDLVIFSRFNTPLLIIECKNSGDNTLHLNPDTRQGRIYKNFGIRVLRYCEALSLQEIVDVITSELEQ